MDESEFGLKMTEIWKMKSETKMENETYVRIAGKGESAAKANGRRFEGRRRVAGSKECEASPGSRMVADLKECKALPGSRMVADSKEGERSPVQRNAKRRRFEGMRRVAVELNRRRLALNEASSATV